MTTFTSSSVPEQDESSVEKAGAGVAPLRLSHGLNLAALWMVVRITASRQGRGRRLIVMAILFSVPVALAMLARQYQHPYEADVSANLLIFGLFFQALVPLAALLFASGMVQDDVEEQTMTYLLIRPIARWAIYLAKLVGTFLITWMRASVFAVATLVTVYWEEQDLWNVTLKEQAPAVVMLLALALGAYTSIFGGMSLLFRRTLIIGAIYIAIFEGLLANIDFVFRYATVMFYIRVLSIRWLNLSGSDWSIDTSTAPSEGTCWLVVLGTIAVFSTLGAVVFSMKEFRVKTPEGS
jgi:ABC-2 type transport system permease protein